MKSKLQEIKENLDIQAFLDYYSNHNIRDTAKYFSISIDRVTQLCKELNFKKDIKSIINQIKATKIKRYGSLQELSKINAAKREKTLLENYSSLEEANKSKIQNYKNTISNKDNYFLNIKDKIDKDEFIDLYINQNKPRSYIRKYYGIKSEYMLDKLITYFNCHKDKRKVIELSFQTKYEEYGGRDQYFDYMVNIIKERKIAHYGSWEAALANTSEKCKQNWNNKSEEELKNIRDKTIKTNLEKYGVQSCYQLASCRLRGNNSKPNQYFSSLLETNNIEYIREFPLDNRSFDFKIGDILIEIDPSATHNSTYGIYDNEPLPYDYHMKKSILAIKNNYRCIHIWDWDNIDKILNILKPKTNIYARKCDVKNIDKETLDDFLNKNHLQNTCKNQTVRLGLYHENKLVQVMSFGKPRYNKKYDYELLRLCTDPNYIIIGGSQKLFKYFISNYNFKSIISYCDNSKFNGNVYSKLNFNLVNKGIPTIHWYNMKTKQHITDNLLRQRGFDQLFNTNYGKGTSNLDLMLKHGFVKIYDCGQSVYKYIK